jgi:hypothetical protein
MADTEAALQLGSGYMRPRDVASRLNVKKLRNTAKCLCRDSRKSTRYVRTQVWCAAVVTPLGYCYVWTDTRIHFAVQNCSANA